MEYFSGGYNGELGCRVACLAGGEAGGVSGFSAGAGPGGQTGRCLLGIGIGHAAEVLILSRFRVWVKEGSGDEERCGAIGRGRAIVAMVQLQADARKQITDLVS